MRALLWVVALCVGCGGSSGSPDLSPTDLQPDFAGEDMAPPAQAYPIDVPMTTALAEGNMRFSVQVQVGDAPPFMALLDTGSNGLRVKPGVLPRSAFEAVVGPVEDIVYGGYLLAEGIAVLARVKIGNAETGVIPIEAFTKLSCASGQPGCVVSNETVANFSGFDAILGVGTRSDFSSPPVANPIAQMAGTPGYVVRAPNFPGTTGTLHIGPTSDEVATFATVQLPPSNELPLPNGLTAYNDLEVPVCFSTGGASYCAASLIDCGAPATYVQYPNLPDQALPSGSMANVVVGPTASPVATYAFTVGQTPQQGLDLVYEFPGSTNISIGTALFFRYDVYVDQVTGRIGFLAHP